MIAATSPQRSHARPNARGPARAEDGAGGPRPERTYQAAKLTRPVRLRLRMWAGFLDKEISELVEEAITAHLDQLDRERQRRGLPPLPLPEA